MRNKISDDIGADFRSHVQTDHDDDTSATGNTSLYRWLTFLDRA
jgi:hypothetical protein